MRTQDYFAAIRRNDVERLRQLLEAEPGLLQATTHPSYAPERRIECNGLHAAVHDGARAAAAALLDTGIDIEARTKEGRSALHDSIELGQPRLTELLIERGAHVDICSAAILDKLDRLRELLDADPGLANDDSTGLSPLGWAAYGNQTETAIELIERGARIDDHELICAASVSAVEVGRLLVERGADPNAVSKEVGANALHAAAAMRYTHDSRPFIRMLLDSGVDTDIRTSSGQTALEIAEERERRQQADPAVNPDRQSKDYGAVAELLRHAAGRRAD